MRSLPLCALAWLLACKNDPSDASRPVVNTAPAVEDHPAYGALGSEFPQMDAVFAAENESRRTLHMEGVSYLRGTDGEMLKIFKAYCLTKSYPVDTCRTKIVEYRLVRKALADAERDAARDAKSANTAKEQALGYVDAPTTLGVRAIEPNEGSVEGGTYVSIRGTGFASGTSRTAKLYFDSKEGTVIRIANDSEVIAEAPAGKLNQTVDIRIVFEPGGEFRLPKAFTFVAAKMPQP